MPASQRSTTSLYRRLWSTGCQRGEWSAGRPSRFTQTYPKLIGNKPVTWCASFFTPSFADSRSKLAYTDWIRPLFDRGCLVTLRLLWLGQVFVFATLIFLPFPPSVEADEVHLGLGAALDSARKENLQVALARTRVSEAERMRTQAGLIPNPSLYATSENTHLSAALNPLPSAMTPTITSI
jgi:hypothetical protein